ncbi:hypothetical protein SUGI_1164230 [Cryptomeria japonica]|uniref:uncharacterized protein LOC131041403 n=1 Tax=Cryptomeria japonica TaxID=3369 RepID=UPI002414B526|nr:uncharacterized protein LOC131041403 [Cryptomeria japonica]GLJ54272.1 hypothetical protein SUGI_1164230 [Cryptomeria japonica]
MIRTSSLLHVLGVTTIILVFILCLGGLLCILYVLHFRFKTHKHHLFALREFNSFWVIRIMLVIFAVLWSLLELLRLPLLRHKGWPLSSMGVHWQTNLCKTHMLLSQGVIEPCFYLTALSLVHGPLQNDPFGPRKKGNGRTVFNILVCCLPVFILQLFILVIGPGITFRGGKSMVKVLPRSFTRTYEVVHHSEGKHDMALCTYPLLSTIVLGSFGFLYISYFLYVCWRMLLLVINKRLQCRVYGLVSTVVLFLPIQVMLLGLSILRKPTEGVFELFSFLGFLTTVMATTLGEGILVIRPIADALAVRWVFNSNTQFDKTRDGPGFSSVSIEVFSGPGMRRDGEERLLGK